MAKLIVDDLGVCESCLAFIANGECGSGDPNEEMQRAVHGVAKLLEDYEIPSGAVVASGDQDEQGYFSWRECDCCHSGLGGHRYKAAILG